MLTTKVLILLGIGTCLCLGEKTPTTEDRFDKQVQNHKQHGRDKTYRHSQSKWDKREVNEPRENEFDDGKHAYHYKETKGERFYNGNEIQDKGKSYKEAKWTDEQASKPGANYEGNTVENQGNELSYNKEEGYEVRQRRSAEEAREREVQRSDRDMEYEKNKKITIQHLPAFSAPPDPNNTVLMARYIVHTVDWAGLATITSRSFGGAFANVISMSDGTVDDSTGVPYFYVTPMDLSTQDVAKDNRVSVVVTLAQTEFCHTHTPSLDPEDPRCARLILSGKMKRVKPSSLEDEFARNALFSRHPAMRNWPNDHGFYVAKLKIGQVVLLDQFGGPKYLDVKEYLNPQPQRD